METFTMFDEYTDHVMTPEERNQKRLSLEPLIFDILKSKYGKQLATYWKSATLTRIENTNKAVVIVEPRIHPNLQFLIHNVAYYARDWAIIIVCSEKNKKYIEAVIDQHKNDITLLPLFDPSGNREQARQDYNALLKSEKFYEAIPCENMMIIQTDAYLRRHVPDTITKWDFVGSPFSWDRDHQGGGLTFRKKSVFLDICRKSNRIIQSEDCFASASIQDFGYKMPKWEEALRYFCESVLFAQTVGVHQWWTFLRNVKGSAQCEQIFHNLLTLEL